MSEFKRSETLDHWYNQIPVCPFCGQEIADDLTVDVSGDDGDVVGFDCENCGKEFHAAVDVTRTFSSGVIE